VAPVDRGKVRGGTLANYELTVRRHISPRIGYVALRNLTSARVEALYAGLAVDGNSRGGGLSPKSVHNVHQVLHRALRSAVRNDLIARNPAEGAHSLPSGRAEMRTWTAEQVAVFLAAASSDRLSAMWRLAATTGMRRGELIGLRWADVDLDARFVSIQQQRVRQGAAGVVYGPPKTGRGRRRLPIGAATAEALRAHRAAQVVVGVDGLVFHRGDGSGLDPDGVSGAFDRIARSAGLPRIRLHDLRHTAATLMLRAGVHPKVVQERLGHASIAMTLDLYSHAVPAMAAEAADMLEAIVDGA
jgi:integrase